MGEIRISIGNGDQGLENPGLELTESDGNPRATKNYHSSEILGENSAQDAPVWRNEFYGRSGGAAPKKAGATHRFLCLLSLAYLAYFIAACWLDFDRALALVILTSLAIGLMAYSLVKKWWGSAIVRMLSPCGKCCRRAWPWLKWVMCIIILIGLITWLVLDISQRREQLVSLGGFAVLVLILFACSKHHRATFLNYTTAGSSFIFGDTLIQEVFAFQVLPIIVFFSCVMSILYYLGVMQFIIMKIEASSLIAASVMAAPCALAMAKLVYPEVEESKFRSQEGVKIACGEEKNILEAAGNGAAVSVGLVANIAANLIAFLAVLEFINATLSWLGGMVNLPELSFQLICSYVLVPFAFLLGASWEDAPLVAEMLGTKIFLNEFVAYQQLSTYKQRRLDGLPEWDGNHKQWVSASVLDMSIRSHKGCNIASGDIAMGASSSMAPQRKSEFSSIVLRALFTGACVSLINACLAGTHFDNTQRVFFFLWCLGKFELQHINHVSPKMLWPLQCYSLYLTRWHCRRKSKCCEKRHLT
ncbi:hypothetical protein JD844_014351 [Phrynosoma platyrhinos]|uniref:Concentrative nucleoside transporter C-terminal domain-containing protein n=1 Tax=Phrynosoma platyrhinos TaxID=52577 RepID=A0ABQ7SRA3_PHRPL|nr:hypothetical protein JD844_014351 [Phrynosoma platyrhinos]